MAKPTLSVPDFPNVPNVAGVPALIRKAGPALNAIGTLSHINNVVERLLGGQIEETWGVFDAAGQEALTPETFLGIDYKNAYRLMDYPLEQGAFETYNKVANPFDAAISMAMGGTRDDREKFLSAVDVLVKSLDLFTIVTPEVTYQSVNLERYDYRRENRNGTHIIIVNLYFREVRVTALVNGVGGINPAAVKSVNSVPARSLGQVAASVVTSVQQAAIAGAARTLNSVKAIGNAIGTAADGITS
jgi:hypothetical protein